MKTTVILSTLVASTAAFAPAGTTAQRANTLTLHAQMSEAVPFLVKPAKLDGTLAGDFGFDPMGISDIQQDLTYARWGELKNGRVAMLAIVGFVVQEHFHLPGEAYQNPDPFGAISSVGLGVNMQILLGIGAVELINFGKHYDGSEPGDLGWTGGFLKGKSAAEIKRLKLSEIKHCRLAMLAVAGILWVEIFGPAPGCEAATAKCQMDAFWQLWDTHPQYIGFGLILTGLIEAITGIAITTGRENGLREPGEFGFDALGFSKGDPEKYETLKLQEVQNSRLAMWAAAGLLLQGCSTHQGGIENLVQAIHDNSF